jgi:hypothetical protein
MNFFFEDKYEYVVSEPIDSVSSQLKSITKTPWYDLAPNLMGTVSVDYTFKLYSKFSFLPIQIFNFFSLKTIIAGKLQSEPDKTKILIKVRPSYLFALTFYLLVIIFLFQLFKTDRNWVEISIFFLFLIFLRSWIYFSAGRLRNRFERELLIRPEE